MARRSARKHADYCDAHNEDFDIEVDGEQQSLGQYVEVAKTNKNPLSPPRHTTILGGHFIQQLRWLASALSARSELTWKKMPDGLETFTIHSIGACEAEMSIFFTTCKWESLKRQLNNYGFVRIVDPDAGGSTWFHRNFTQDGGSDALIHKADGRALHAGMATKKQAKKRDPEGDGSSALPGSSSQLSPPPLPRGGDRCASDSDASCSGPSAPAAASKGKKARGRPKGSTAAARFEAAKLDPTRDEAEIAQVFAQTGSTPAAPRQPRPRRLKVRSSPAAATAQAVPAAPSPAVDAWKSSPVFDANCNRRPLSRSAQSKHLEAPSNACSECAPSPPGSGRNLTAESQPVPRAHSHSPSTSSSLRRWRLSPSSRQLPKLHSEGLSLLDTLAAAAAAKEQGFSSLCSMSSSSSLSSSSSFSSSLSQPLSSSSPACCPSVSPHPSDGGGDDDSDHDTMSTTTPQAVVPSATTTTMKRRRPQKSESPSHDQRFASQEEGQTLGRGKRAKAQAHHHHSVQWVEEQEVEACAAVVSDEEGRKEEDNETGAALVEHHPLYSRPFDPRVTLGRAASNLGSLVGSSVVPCAHLAAVPPPFPHHDFRPPPSNLPREFPHLFPSSGLSHRLHDTTLPPFSFSSSIPAWHGSLHHPSTQPPVCPNARGLLCGPPSSRILSQPFLPRGRSFAYSARTAPMLLAFQGVTPCHAPTPGWPALWEGPPPQARVVISGEWPAPLAPHGSQPGLRPPATGVPSSPLLASSQQQRWQCA